VLGEVAELVYDVCALCFGARDWSGQIGQGSREVGMKVGGEGRGRDMRRRGLGA